MRDVQEIARRSFSAKEGGSSAGIGELESAIMIREEREPIKIRPQE